MTFIQILRIVAYAFVFAGVAFNPYFYQRNFQTKSILYFLLCYKNIRFDFDDELKIGDVGYKHLT